MRRKRVSVAKRAERTRWRAKTSVKIPRFSKRRESKAGMCSVDAARHPPFSANARASQGQARSSPPEPPGELDSSLTSRYERPYAIKRRSKIAENDPRDFRRRETVVSIGAWARTRLTVRHRSGYLVSYFKRVLYAPTFTRIGIERRLRNFLSTSLDRAVELHRNYRPIKYL